MCMNGAECAPLCLFHSRCLLQAGPRTRVPQASEPAVRLVIASWWGAGTESEAAQAMQTTTLSLGAGMHSECARMPNLWSQCTALTRMVDAALLWPPVVHESHANVALHM